MHQQISSGTIDSPSWDLVRTAKLAARIYAPLGTRMSLGDHIRVVRAFLDAFRDTEDPPNRSETDPVKDNPEIYTMLVDLRGDLKVREI
jgi:glycerol-3-phosphate O-acyltransferase / dihydroxyacetone phosphate acyltransferase